MSKRWIAAVALSMVAVVTGAVGAKFYKAHTTPRINVEQFVKPAERVEMMDVSTNEWIERHFPGANGKDERTQVIFRDKNVGWRYYRPDGTLSELQIFNPEGVKLVHLFYSPRGQMPVSGFERRNDGTMRREVIDLGNNMVQTRVFWQDGVTLFSVQERGVDEYTAKTVYFHDNGKLWAEQEGNLYGYANKEAQYDRDGNPVRFYEWRGAYDGIVKHFRPDGTLRYVQHYAPFEYEMPDEHGPSMVKERRLSYVEEFDGSERVTRRITMVPGGHQIDFVEVLRPGKPTQRIKVDPETGPALNLPPEAVNTKIEPVKPRPVWEEAEAKVSLIIEAR